MKQSDVASRFDCDILSDKATPIDWQNLSDDSQPTGHFVACEQQVATCSAKQPKIQFWPIHLGAKGSH